MNCCNNKTNRTLQEKMHNDNKKLLNKIITQYYRNYNRLPSISKEKQDIDYKKNIQYLEQMKRRAKGKQVEALYIININ